MAANPLPTTDEPGNPPEFATYRLRLANDPRWALSEGSLFFEDKGAVQESLRRIAGRLNDLQIPYAVVGGMALFQHGYRRFTEDVDILVTREGLKRIHHELAGRGYVRPFERSKNLLDAESRVKIEFLIAGEYPGDGKPKPVQFPDPQQVAVTHDGIKFLNLRSLVELKLASGMTGADRMRDLADVQELIKLLNLSEDFGADVNESVRGKYLELWGNVHRGVKRYVQLRRTNLPATDAQSSDRMIESLRASIPEFAAMQADGVQLEISGGIADGYVRLVTTDPLVAKKYGMQDESELWVDDEDVD